MMHQFTFALGFTFLVAVNLTFFTAGLAFLASGASL